VEIERIAFAFRCTNPRVVTNYEFEGITDRLTCTIRINGSFNRSEGESQSAVLIVMGRQLHDFKRVTSMSDSDLWTERDAHIEQRPNGSAESLKLGWQ
jgi:hypothetical protein